MTTTELHRKSVLIPAAGMFFTDGSQLVEILGKLRSGYRACNVCVPIEEIDDVPMILLSASDVNGGAWRQVIPT